jgi:hypothetical protein
MYEYLQAHLLVLNVSQDYLDIDTVRGSVDIFSAFYTNRAYTMEHVSSYRPTFDRADIL